MRTICVTLVCLSCHIATSPSSTHSYLMPPISPQHQQRNDRCTMHKTTTSRGQVWTTTRGARAHRVTRGGRTTYVHILIFLWCLLTAKSPNSAPALKMSVTAPFKLASQGTQGDERRANNVRSHFHSFNLMSTNYKTSPNSAPALKTSSYARFWGFNFSDHDQLQKQA